MSLTLPAVHTDGAVRTEPPPIQNTHPAHTQGRCRALYCRFEDLLPWLTLGQHLDFPPVRNISSCVIRYSIVGDVSDNQNR